MRRTPPTIRQRCRREPTPLSMTTSCLKAKKAMIDAARLADELRGEQELAQALERDRKLLEVQAKEMQQRLDEAESNAFKAGKKAMNKMETRIRELESELDSENR